MSLQDISLKLQTWITEYSKKINDQLFRFVITASDTVRTQRFTDKHRLIIERYMVSHDTIKEIFKSFEGSVVIPSNRLEKNAAVSKMLRYIDVYTKFIEKNTDLMLLRCYALIFNPENVEKISQFNYYQEHDVHMINHRFAENKAWLSGSLQGYISEMDLNILIQDIDKMMNPDGLVITKEAWDSFNDKAPVEEYLKNIQRDEISYYGLVRGCSEQIVKKINNIIHCSSAYDQYVETNSNLLINEKDLRALANVINETEKIGMNRCNQMILYVEGLWHRLEYYSDLYAMGEYTDLFASVINNGKIGTLAKNTYDHILGIYNYMCGGDKNAAKFLLFPETVVAEIKFINAATGNTKPISGANNEVNDKILKDMEKVFDESKNVPTELVVLKKSTDIVKSSLPQSVTSEYSEIFIDPEHKTVVEKLCEYSRSRFQTIGDVHRAEAEKKRRMNPNPKYPVYKGQKNAQVNNSESTILKLGLLGLGAAGIAGLVYLTKKKRRRSAPVKKTLVRANAANATSAANGIAKAPRTVAKTLGRRSMGATKNKNKKKHRTKAGASPRRPVYRRKSRKQRSSRRH